jgi:hypothetical protein
VRDDDFIDVILLQGSKSQLLVVGVVFHEKNDLVLHDSHSLRSHLRQRKIKRCALVHRAFRPYSPTVPANDPLHRSQSDPCSRELAIVVETLKNAEQAGGIRGLESRTVVTNKKGRNPVALCSAEFDKRAFRFELNFQASPSRFLKGDPQ